MKKFGPSFQAILLNGSVYTNSARIGFKPINNIFLSSEPIRFSIKINIQIRKSQKVKCFLNFFNAFTSQIKLSLVKNRDILRKVQLKILLKLLLKILEY